jgi:hypothetical protein
MKKTRIISTLLLVTALLAFAIPVFSMPTADVDDSYTKSLLHFDGADASTTFTDESGKTWTAGGSASLTTAVYKFGSASLAKPSSGYIQTSDHSDFTLGTNNFTIDFWIYFQDVFIPTSGQAVGVFQLGASNSNRPFLIRFSNSSGTKKLEVSNTTLANGTTNVFGNYNVDMPVNTWVHLAIVRDGSTFSLYKDGLSQGSFSSNGEIDDKDSYVSIGKSFNSTSSVIFEIDEFRFSNGIARWTSNFTPPSDHYFPTPTPTDTATFTPSFTPTITDTPTNTATHTYTPTITDTPTVTPSHSPTPTDTPTETRTPTPTATVPTLTPVTPIWEMDPTITYGDYMNSVIMLGLCGVVIIGMIVIVTLMLIRRKRGS